jgi:flagellin
MGLSYSSNIPALRAARRLNQAGDKLSETFARLSSGTRINTGSDDPAGLALADALRADTAVATVAIRNTSDGISQVSIADTAASEISNILTRMAELAQQSANGTFTQTQRSVLSSEFLALGSEIERIAGTTKFNGIRLLSATTHTTLQVGLEGNMNSTIVIGSVLGTLSSMNLSSAGGSKLSFSIITTTTAGSQTAAQQALDAVNAALNTMTSVRGTLGAAESRLNSAVNNLTIARENFAAAEARIRDIDIATETAEMARLTILQQGAAAVLAQANIQPEVALRLLQ